MKKLLAILLLLVSSYAHAEVWKISMTFTGEWWQGTPTINVSGQFTTQGNSVQTWAFLPYVWLADTPPIYCNDEECGRPYATATFLSPEHIFFESGGGGSPSGTTRLDLWFDAPLTPGASLIDADLRVLYGQDSIGLLTAGTITAVPEPSSWLILLVAMLFLAHRLHRQTFE